MSTIYEVKRIASIKSWTEASHTIYNAASARPVNAVVSDIAGSTR